MQVHLRDRILLPFCAFNGGQDVFVDVGNKSLGLDALLKHLHVKPHQVCAPAGGWFVKSLCAACGCWCASNCHAVHGM